MKKLTLLLIIFSVFFAQDLDGKKRAKVNAESVFSELEGEGSILKFIDINHQEKLVSGKCIVADHEFEIVDGQVNFPQEFLEEIGDKDVLIKFYSEKYIDTYFKIPVYLGAIQNKHYVFVMDKQQPKKVSIILDWNNDGGSYDLDSHLKSSTKHIYYRNKSSYGSYGEKIYLNRDVRRSNSFEVITIDKPSVNEIYKYAVKKYRGPKNWTAKSVSVTVYFDNKVQEQFNLENIGKTKNNVWNVFQLNSYGKIEVYDSMSKDLSF